MPTRFRAISTCVSYPWFHLRGSGKRRRQLPFTYSETLEVGTIQTPRRATELTIAGADFSKLWREGFRLNLSEPLRPFRWTSRG